MRVKGAEEGNKSHADLTKHCGKSPVATNNEHSSSSRLSHLAAAPTPLDQGDI